MRQRPRGRPARLSTAFLAAVLCGTFCGLACGASAGETSGRSASYERADAETIRAEIRNILADPRLAPRRTFSQWLSEKLTGWEGPDLDFTSGWTKAIFWLFTIWCILALVAILGHLLWVAFTSVRAGSGKGRFDLRQRRAADAQEQSYDDLRDRMRRLADRGVFREAVGLMMIALLRWLDAAGMLRFDDSKTNGDYAREYPPGTTGREAFRRFASAFDALVYSGASCDRQTYQEMDSTFERIRRDVHEREKI